MSNKDADDVLDFINSLPDTKTTPGSGGGRKSESNDEFKDFLDELSAHEKASKGPIRTKLEPRKRDDVRDVRRPTSGVLSPASSRRIVSSSTESKVDGATVDSTAGSPVTVAPLTPTVSSGATYSPAPTAASEKAPLSSKLGASSQKEVQPEEESMIDPIGSISSWWSTEGSSKVLSLWGSLASNATQLGETTFQLASTTSQQLSHQKHKFLVENPGLEAEQITHLTGKLNSILSTVSQQIKDGLIDKDDELLNIFLVYDWENISDLDSLCARKFDAVMDQIEGGVRVSVNNFNHKHEQTDREEGSQHYDLGMFYGKAIDGEKLCFANLESSIKDYLKITKETGADQTSEVTEKEDEIASSNIFIAIQPICVGQQSSESESSATSSPIFIEANNASSFAFTMILKDITNNITIVSKSQPFPLKWAKWLAGSHEDVDTVFAGEDGGAPGVDPSEWVSGWIKNGLELSFAVLAQEYITNRMGI
ncbi:hypothetical protein PUMCH_001221 [Australozyma saopauloensis]|uniref:Maintenance of telomere capping protein 1 n=1 Tax=Australozyma saopauloensis TaxID=291208 RepID=A0AAX4H6I1_9ASCO|nr:hypothetical protein PUMCH_001221 [[Candida] saopauloensis]